MIGHGRLLGGDHRRCEVVAVGVVLVVIGVLVVGEEVLRDPDEDVEADWVGCAKKRKARERERES